MKKMLQYTFFVSLLLSCELPYDNIDKETTGNNPTSASLPATITFAKNYGSPEFDERTHAVIQTFDGGYAILGFLLGPKVIYFVKTDRYGNLQWQNTYTNGLGDGNGGQDLRQTPDSGFILTGNSEEQTLVFKINKYGTVQWEWHGPWFSESRSIALSNDNGYVVVGYYNVDVSISGILAFKLSNAGNLLWTRMYLTESDAIGNSIERTSDNGFIIAGTARTDEDKDICLLKIDAQGNLQWNTFWGGSYSDYGNHAIQTTDGGYAVIGVDGKENNSQVYLVKTDSQGRYQWIKGYFPSNGASGNCVFQTPDHGFAITGSAYNKDILIKVSSNGSHKWNKNFSNKGVGSVEDVAATSDGGYALTGLVINAPGGWQAALVKTDKYGNY